MKILRFILPAAFALAAMGYAQELREEFHQSYTLGPNGRITLKNVNGAVRITAWDRAEVKVDAVKKGKTQQALQEAQIVVDARSDAIDIRTKYPEESRRDAASVDYTVMVPRMAQLESVGTVNGTVRVEGVTGPVKASSVNGNVEAEGASGDLDLESVNGKVEANFDRLNAREVSMKTVNGGVDVGLPSGAGARVTASTVHGGIDSDFDLPVRKMDFGPGADVKATIGGGGPDLRLKTVNGSIHLRRR